MIRRLKMLTNSFNVTLFSSLDNGYYDRSAKAVREFGFPPETVSAILAESVRKGISAEAVVISALNRLYGKEAQA